MSLGAFALAYRNAKPRTLLLNEYRVMATSSRHSRLFSSQHDGGESTTTRPSLRRLLGTLEQLPGRPLPASLHEKLRSYSSREESLSSGEFEEMKLDVARHINAMVRSQMKADTSDAAYSPESLDLYDAYVWGFNSPFLWRIPGEECQSLYDDNVRSVHCDIAVGTGLFLKEMVAAGEKVVRGGKCPWSLTLVDLNENSLDNCAKRVGGAEMAGKGRSWDITRIVADIIVSGSLPAEMVGAYESVSANFLFHCLHGDSLLDKRAAFRNCASLLSDTVKDDEKGGNYFFGGTILGKDILDDASNAGEAAMETLEQYNRWGIFGNRGDSYEDLVKVLEETFDDVQVWKMGYVGLWKVRRPKNLITI